MAYFIGNYCQIYNATDREWISFDLWPEQERVLQAMRENRHVIVLKARQLGLSWLTICYTLWLMLYHPAVTALIFSRRDDEAVDLLGARMKGVYQRLPAFLQAATVTADSAHNWHLSNGSRATALPTTGGRSYTASVVMVDEADFMPDLDGLLNAVKPTIDAGGQIVLISTVDKSQPSSSFKRIYRGARAGNTEWADIFLPWYSRPTRDKAWYDAQSVDILARTGALDDLHQEYPATDTEALAPRTLDKRIPATWIEKCFAEMQPMLPDDAPPLDGLEIYAAPIEEHNYVVGGDPAEGNPTSDDSALTVMDVQTGEEVAALAGKFEPTVLAAHADAIGVWYNNAGLMVERNNHGHAVIAWLRDNSKLRILFGHDGKDGWLSSSLGKTLMYNEAADAFRNHDTTLHSFDTYTQLASIEGSSLRAPQGQHDDRADSYALAQVGRAAMMTQPRLTRAGIRPGAANLYGSRDKSIPGRTGRSTGKKGRTHGARSKYS